jgi:hypothetical protein
VTQHWHRCSRRLKFFRHQPSGTLWRFTDQRARLVREVPPDWDNLGEGRYRRSRCQTLEPIACRRRRRWVRPQLDPVWPWLLAAAVLGEPLLLQLAQEAPHASAQRRDIGSPPLGISNSLSHPLLVVKCKPTENRCSADDRSGVAIVSADSLGVAAAGAQGFRAILLLD